MRIAGLQKSSLVDWPGRIAAVLFTPGCNMNCFYCHNRSLIGENAELSILSRDEVFTFLRRRRGLLDGVVVSGGEPTLQHDLCDCVTELRGLGYDVKLDTNGTRPAVLETLLRKRLVDYVAMDVKASATKYDNVCGVPVDQGSVNRSIRLLLDSDIDHEFRTTLAPQLTCEDIVDISCRVRGANRYVLQECRPVKGQKEFVPFRHDESWLAEVLEAINDTVQRIELRGFESPTPVPPDPVKRGAASQAA